MQVTDESYDIMVKLYALCKCEICSDKWDEFLTPIEDLYHMYQMLELQRAHPDKFGLDSLR